LLAVLVTLHAGMGIDTSKRGSSLGGFLNFFKSLFGAGILSLANAFSTTGLAPAVLIFAFVAVTCYGTMMMLLHCKDVASKR
jgi:amino acid permease